MKGRIGLEGVQVQFILSGPQVGTSSITRLLENGQEEEKFCVCRRGELVEVQEEPVTITSYK